MKPKQLEFGAIAGVSRMHASIKSSVVYVEVDLDAVPAIPNTAELGESQCWCLVTRAFKT